MNAVIQAPPEAIEHGLYIEPATAGAKAFKNSAVDVRLAVI